MRKGTNYGLIKMFSHLVWVFLMFKYRVKGGTISGNLRIILKLKTL